MPCTLPLACPDDLLQLGLAATFTVTEISELPPIALQASRSEIPSLFGKMSAINSPLGFACVTILSTCCHGMPAHVGDLNALAFLKNPLHTLSETCSHFFSSELLDRVNDFENQRLLDTSVTRSGKPILETVNAFLQFEENVTHQCCEVSLRRLRAHL